MHEKNEIQLVVKSIRCVVTSPFKSINKQEIDSLRKLLRVDSVFSVNLDYIIVL